MPLRWWLTVGGAGLGGAGLIGLALLSVTSPRDPRRVAGQSIAPPKMAIEGLRTSVYQGDRLQLRVSADTVRVTSPRFLGPFRIGFLRALDARNVTIETFEGEAADRERSNTSLAMTDALSALAPKPLKKGITYAEAEPVKLIRHRGGAAPFTLEAEQCYSSATTSTAVCRSGWLGNGSTRLGFREATYDGKVWTITHPEKGE